MPEYRKVFDLPAASLSRSDVEALGRLICEGLPVVPKSFEFILEAGEASFRAYSLDELLAQNLPDSITGLKFKVQWWNDNNNIDCGATITLGRTYASSQVHSLDEVWFKGKIQQITEFFLLRQPWYGTVRSKLAGIFGGLQGLAIFALWYFLLTRQFLFVGIAGITLAILWKGFSAYLCGSLFPLTNIRLGGGKHRRIDMEIAMVVFTAIGAIGTVAGVIAQFIQKGGS
jgi:hypothetical protein